jgi:hypothetical protein
VSYLQRPKHIFYQVAFKFDAGHLCNDQGEDVIVGVEVSKAVPVGEVSSARLRWRTVSSRDVSSVTNGRRRLALDMPLV